MKMLTRTLTGTWKSFDLTEIGTIYKDDDVIYIGGTPCRLSECECLDCHERDQHELEAMADTF